MDNKGELKKIETAISGMFKGKARKVVAAKLQALKKDIDLVKLMTDTDRDVELKRLLVASGDMRHKALQSGANSYGHPEWAAASACESWLFSLLMDTPEDLAIVEMYVESLSG